MSLRNFSTSLKWTLRLGGSPRGNDWDRAIEQVIHDLENLNRLTERDFLAVGEKLMGFRLAARQIAADLAALTELISGEHSRNASHALSRMLDQTAEMGARVGQSGAALGQVRDLSSRIRQAFAGLRNTVPVFRTLCTLTRIETSRLGNTGAGFGDLAAEVMPLSESVRCSGESVLEASSRLDESIQCAIEHGSELRLKQLRELPGLIAGITGGLQSLEERRQRALESSSHQAAQYRVLCDAVDDVVRSVQFHDITRQQIEHVMHALRQLRSPLEAGRGSQVTATPGTCAILTLQAAQLSRAAEVFASTVERMERDLENIAGRAQVMAEASRQLMGISADEHDSFFARLEGHFNDILTMLGTCTTAQAEMEATAAQLEETIGRMRGSVAEIRGVEIAIQRIATNATIRATHIGAAGDALNVIAEVMQRLALDSNTNTEAVAATLDAMSEAALGVSGGSDGAASAAHAATNEAIDEMRRRVLELNSSNETSFRGMKEIAALGSRLAADIGALRGGFSAGPLFAEVVERAMRELNRIAPPGGQAFAEGCAVAPNRQLADLAESYTMQIQREVHETVVQGAAVAGGPIAPSGAAGKDGDLGDNVELF